MSAEVIQLVHRWTETQYETERAKLVSLYGENSRMAAAKRDQAMAELFVRSGWTQEELAQKENKGQQWVSRHLSFGRFLSFTPNGVNAKNPAETLTEGAFRKLWEQTDKALNEPARFQEVLKLMEQEAAMGQIHRKSIAKPIIADFADGKWHLADTIAKKISADENHVTDTLKTMCKPGGTFGCKAESRTYGTTRQYRIFKQDKMISLHEIKFKLAPLIEGLREEGKKNLTTACPPAVAHLALSIQALLNEWAQ